MVQRAVAPAGPRKPRNAICEAVTRPSRTKRAFTTMRFVPVKSEATQGHLVTHVAPQVNLRCDMRAPEAQRAREFGVVIPKGIQNVGRLIDACGKTNLPATAHKSLNLLADQLVDTQRKIADLTADVHVDANTNESAQRLQNIPGIGRSRPVRWSHPYQRCPTSCPDGIFQHHAESTPLACRGEPGNDWLWKIIQRTKPRQAAIALANRMARTVYALLKNGTEFKAAMAACTKPGVKASDRKARASRQRHARS